MLLGKAYRPDPRVYKEAVTLSKNKFNISILSWDRECKFPKYEKHAESQIFRFHFFRTRGYSLIKFLIGLILFNITATVWAFNKKIDYVHSNDLDTLFGGFLISKIKRAKLVYDAHESYADLIAPYVPRLIVHIVCLVESVLVRKADYVITENEVKEQILLKRGAMRVHILPNVPILSLFQNLNNSNPKKVLGFEGKFVILYIGEVMPGRNLEMLIDLAVLLEAKGILDIVFMVVGDGILLPKIKRLVRLKNLNQYFKFVDWVPPTSLSFYYAASDVVYILLEHQPINMISMPNKLFEAIASGKPVLVSNFGKLGKMVRSTGCGLLCNPGNVNDVLKKIILLKDNSELRGNMEKQAVQISREYSWESVEHVLVNIYSGRKE